MKRKIYISINIPESDKKRLTEAVSKWRDLPVKWVKEPNLHLTLAYLGHVGDDAIVEICQKVKKAVSSKQLFDLHFSDIELNSETESRLVWISGEESQELLKLQEDIEKELDIFVSEKKSFIPHITLGKIRKQKWEAMKKKPPASTCGDALPASPNQGESTRGWEIKKELMFALTVESVDVMASDFENEGQEYSIVESCELDG